MNEVQIEMKALLKELKQLENKHANKIIRTSQRRSAKILLQPMKSQSPKKTGNLRKNIKIKSGRRSRRVICLDIGIMPDGFYGSFLNLGWKHGKKGTPNRKQIEGSKWVNKIYAAHKSEVSNKTVEEIRERLAKAANGVK